MTKYYQLIGGVGSYKIKIQKLHALCEHIEIGTSYSEKYIRLFFIDAISCVTSK